MSEALRLFLVEDDDDIALLMRKCLQRAGCQVTHCRTAADALIVLGHSSFNLVLLDQRLPDMSGLDLLGALAREGITTPVLMVTGYGDEQLATQVLRAGALDYLVKDPALTFLTELPKRVRESVTRHRLQDMNRLLIESLESARDGIAITDLQGTFLHVNRALEGMTGYSREQLLGQNPRLFKSGLHPAEFYAGMWRTVLARNSWQGEVINRRADGTLLDASLTISPILDGRGQMTHFVAIYRDVTDRKQLERQLLQAQKMQSVGTLAGGVAHEFNNLLAGIQGYAALGLREPGVAGTVQEFFEKIVGLSERAAGLTRQLLAFARKPALSRQQVRMDRLVRETAELVRHTLGTDVVVGPEEAGPDGEPLAALADVNQLQQVLINLALNARDALTARRPGERGAGELISFRLRHAVLRGDLPAFPENVPPGDYVVVEVQDTGTGMPPEVLAQALDPFFTTKEVGQGTGLGLPVAFGIVRGHQGFLVLDTLAGQGTCVSVYLPRLTGTAADDALDFEPGQVLEPDSQPGRTILVVDDEDAVLDVVRRFLEIAGHRVTCAASGAQALDLLREGLSADLVVLDLMMPREDGATTFRGLRRLRPGLPVLLCTGIVQSEPSALLAEGAVGLLRKPFRMNELWYAVNQALPSAG